jgi:hypothetical protein
LIFVPKATSFPLLKILEENRIGQTFIFIKYELHSLRTNAISCIVSYTLYTNVGNEIKRECIRTYIYIQIRVWSH